MSGIVGIVNLDGSPVSRDLLGRMTGYLVHRGPDAQEFRIDGNAGLGHAMLRTTPESLAEHQPFTLDGTTWITADCRVDARADLLRELEARGCVPDKDVPDAGLILHAHAVWGPKCVDHLLGDFAFALWDSRSRTLFCARDHLGVKPFYYARAGTALIVGNDLDCVRLHPAVSTELDEVAIADFLVYGYALDVDRTSFAAIRRLPPSHTLTACDGRVSVDRYWQLPLEEEIRHRRRGDYVEPFLELLETATRDRLRTGTVSVFMSGGLDSTSIAATAHRILSASGSPFDLRAHTVVFDRIVADDERRYSQLAADAIGIPIHHYPFDDYGFPASEPEPPWYPPEPRGLFDRSRTIAVNRGPAAASRVLLRGDGADPLLDAHPLTALERRLSERRPGRLLGDLIRLTLLRRRIPRVGIRTLLKTSIGRAVPPAVTPYPRWLEPGLEQRLDLRSRWRAETEAQDIRPGFELAHTYWPTCFELLDPGSMHLAAEVRYPYADIRLVRYLLRVPPIPWLIEKTLLRVAMEGVLPKAILRRPKTPMAGNPWAVLLPGAETRWWEEHLVASPELEHFVDIGAAKAMLETVAGDVQARREHEDIGMLFLCLKPVALSVWLRQTRHGRLRPDRPLPGKVNS